MGDTYAQKAASLYQSLSLIPTIDAAYLFPTPSQQYSVLIKSSQTDVHQAKKRSFLISKTISEKGLEVAKSPYPFDVSTASIISPSPSGKYLAVVRIDGDKKDEPFIEIWDSYSLTHNVACKGKGHSAIYADDWFGSLAWSPDEKYLAYIAEPLVVNSSFWDKDQKDASKLGHKFDLREDWGEGFIGLSSPSIFLLEIEKENIISVKLDDKTLSTGQVIWSPDGSELVFTAWPVINRRLGIKFCYNRDSAIYRVGVAALLAGQHPETKVEDKTKADATTYAKAHLVSEAPKSRAARFPRFSPDGSILVYFGSENMITHNGAVKLLKVDWKTKQTATAVDTVARPKDAETFPGLFVDSLPRRCFLDNTHILTHTQWRSSLVPVVININTGDVQKLTVLAPFFSSEVVDVVGSSFLMTSSSPVAPSTCVFGTFTGSNFNSNSVLYSPIHKPVNAGLLTDLAFVHKSVQPTAPPEYPFDIIFVHPANKKDVPLLVYPHGGPHSSFSGEYSTLVAFLVLLGYSVVQINYRGSLGFGSDFVDELPGRCGELDVSDCVDATRHVLGLGIVNPDKVAVIGGSHGGFLAAHLIGGSFDKINFKACVMRNPVVDIVSMISTTDIPDWCLVETGAISTPTFVPSLEQIGRMHKSSPMAHIDKVKTPTLFLLGEVDRRVPTSQGLSMYHALLERNVVSRVQFYPKTGHGLAGAEADPDQAVNTAIFLNEFL